MPIPFFFYIIENGPPSWLLDHVWLIVKTIIVVAAIALLKLFSSGARNSAERNMHGRVVMLTGGTSGIGACVALQLASRGAQLVLLTHSSPTDPFLIEQVQDLRDRSGNQMVYAEQVDLSSLHSIRLFATRWIDNAPPRRLDAVILCAATLTPPGHLRAETSEGVEKTFMVNYLANFHLLSLLSPAIKAQPVDRDIRIILVACPSYISSPPIRDDPVELSSAAWSPYKAYARSKLALLVFGQAFQKHLDAYKRPDGAPSNARVVFVDPGYTRTLGMRRWLSRGSLWGLAIYLVGYAIPWLLLKSPNRGAQSILHAAMEQGISRGKGGRMIKECQEVDFARTDFENEELAKRVWQESDSLIERLEKEQALKRARAKGNENGAQGQVRPDDNASRDEVADSSLHRVSPANMGKEKSKKSQKKDLQKSTSR